MFLVRLDAYRDARPQARARDNSAPALLRKPGESEVAMFTDPDVAVVLVGILDFASGRYSVVDEG
jgi:hypothetical protein